jgi:membrane-associated phospholipid phosphatase
LLQEKFMGIGHPAVAAALWGLLALLLAALLAASWPLGICAARGSVHGLGIVLCNRQYCLRPT